MSLSARRRLAKQLTLTALLELQIASARYYFSVANVITFLYCFSEDPQTQAKVVVALFSRVYDLWDIDLVARQLSTPALYEVVQRVGWLNFMNPLKPAYDYVLPLAHLDNRIHLTHLLELSAAEAGDMLKEKANSGLSVVFLYGKIASLASDSKYTEVVRLAFCEFGERSVPVNWNQRREFLKKYLIGTQPMDNAILDTIAMYNEMQAAGTLTVGPIDVQYQSHLKTPKIKRKYRNMFRSVQSNGQAAVDLDEND